MSYWQQQWNRRRSCHRSIPVSLSGTPRPCVCEGECIWAGSLRSLSRRYVVFPPEFCFLQGFYKHSLSLLLSQYGQGCSPDPRAALMDHCEASYIKEKECYPCPHPPEESCEQSASDTGWPSHVRKLINSTYSPHEGPGPKNVCPNKSSLDFSPSSEPASITSSNSFLGKFIQLWDTLTWDS